MSSTSDAPDLDLLYSELEVDLRSAVRSMLTDRCPSTAVAAMYDADDSIVRPLWRTLGIDLGLAGLLIPEEQGGAGASAREAGVVLEELGRFVAPVPFLSSAVVATALVLEGADQALLEALAAGDRTAALAVPLTTAPGRVVAAVRADQEGRLTGSVTSVAGAGAADVLLVPAATDDGVVSVYLVVTNDAERIPVTSLDMSRPLTDIVLNEASGTLLIEDAAPALSRALTLGAALLASEQFGLAQWCLEATVAHLKQRRQFGRIVGGFQSLKHRLAELYAEVEAAGAVARHAAAAQAEGDDREAAIAASIAQAYCSGVAVHAAEEAIQLHGGIGMTWESPLHLYLKRAKADQLACGGAAWHRASLATYVDLLPPTHSEEHPCPN